MDVRVMPVLQQQITDGIINLTAIINTHQFVPSGWVIGYFTNDHQPSGPCGWE
jgi:hypothetical protein